MNNKIVDKSGNRYTRILVVRYSHSNEKGAVWECLCDCGKYKLLESFRLNYNKKGVKSCGCIKTERKPILKDISNLKYGRLTVIKPTEIFNISGSRLWECLCDCGKTTNVSTSSLNSKHTRSCGCLNRDILKKTGKDHHKYDNNITDEDRNKTRLNSDYKHWRMSIYKRDNWTCQISGIKGLNICAHHILNWKHNESIRFDIKNGITLTNSIHRLFHKIYGKKHNNEEQFLEFKSRWDSGEWLDYQI